MIVYFKYFLIVISIANLRTSMLRIYFQGKKKRKKNSQEEKSTRRSRQRSIITYLFFYYLVTISLSSSFTLNKYSNLFNVVYSIRKFKWHDKWTNMVHNVKINQMNKSTLSFILHEGFWWFSYKFKKTCYYVEVEMMMVKC